MFRLNERVRILYVIGPMMRGGAERHLIDLVANLDRERFKPFVAVLGEKGALYDELMLTGAEVINIPKFGKLDVTVIFRLKKLYEKIAPHIIHTFMWTGNFWGRLAIGKKPPLLVITGERGRDLWKSWYHRFFDRLLARKSNLILAVSDSVKEHYRKITGDTVPVEVIGNGKKMRHRPPDEYLQELRDELKIPRNAPVAIMVGRLAPEKRHVDLLEAAYRLRKDGINLQLLFVGGGPCEKEIREYAARLSLTECLFMTGEVADPFKYIALSDMLVLASDYEGFPNVLLEAGMALVPCISTSVDAAPEILDNGKAGILVPPRDPASLALAIEKLVSCRAEGEKLAAALYMRVKEQYTLEKMVAAYQKCYMSWLEKALTSRESEKQKKKKVLCVFYPVPPGRGAGVPRLIKFVKNLPALGWSPVIIAPSRPIYRETDRSFLSELPEEVRIKRTPYFEIGHILRKFLSIFSRKKIETEGRAATDSINRHMHGTLESTVLKAREVEKYFYGIPDDKMGWVPWALIYSLFTAWKTGTPLVFTSSFPLSSHIVGIIMSFLGFKWVADFRSPLGYRTRVSTRLSGAIDMVARSLTWLVLNRADAVTASSGMYAKQLENLLGKKKKKNGIDVIYEGFDIKDYSFFQGQAPSEKTIIAIWSGSNSEEISGIVTQAIIDVLLRGHTNSGSAVFSLWGKGHEESIKILSEKAMEYIHYSAIRYDKAVETRCMASVNIVIVGETRQERELSAQLLVEALGAAKPIILIAKVSDPLSVFIRKSGLGEVVEPWNSSKLKKLLREILVLKKPGSSPAPEASKYSSRAQTALLAAIFERVLFENSEQQSND